MWLSWLQEAPLHQTASGGNEAKSFSGAQKPDVMPSRLHSTQAQVTRFSTSVRACT